jgi:hypothetical protein
MGLGGAVFDVPSGSWRFLLFAAGVVERSEQAQGSTGRGWRATAGFATDPFAEEGLEALRNWTGSARAGDRGDGFGLGKERAGRQGKR